MVDALKREVPGHELYDGLDPHEGCSYGQSREACFGDRSINDPSISEFLEEPLGNLVRALVLCHFFAHQYHLLVITNPKGYCWDLLIYGVGRLFYLILRNGKINIYFFICV